LDIPLEMALMFGGKEDEAYKISRRPEKIQ
jgi:hypothetical protein